MKEGQIKFGTGNVEALGFLTEEGVIKYKTIDERPPRTCLGYDEQDKEWRRVKYFSDSNRFFDFNGAVYPIDRMNKWKEENEG